VYLLLLCFFYSASLLSSSTSSLYSTGSYLAGGVAAASGMAAAGLGIHSGFLAQARKRKKKLGQLRLAKNLSTRMKRAHAITASIGAGSLVSAALSVLLYKKYYAVKHQEAQRQREVEAQRQREVEAQRQREAEAQRQREAEAQRQREAEAQRQRETEAQRQREAEAQRQREAEAQRQREAEAQRQREAEAQRQREVEAQRQREASSSVELQVRGLIDRTHTIFEKQSLVFLTNPIESHLRHIYFMLGEVNKNPRITDTINSVRETALQRQRLHRMSTASGETDGVRNRDGRVYTVRMEGQVVRLRHKAVENYEDKTCVGHSMALAVLGYPYQGASIALCLALNAYSSSILTDLSSTINGTNIVEFNSTVQALADWSGRPVYVWQWGSDAFASSAAGIDQTQFLSPYFDSRYSKMIPRWAISLTAEDAIHLFYVKWRAGGAHCEVLVQEKFWDLNSLAKLNLDVFKKARKAFMPFLRQQKEYLVAGSLSLRQYIEVYIQSLACAHRIEQKENISSYLEEIKRLDNDSYSKLHEIIKNIIAFIIVSADMLYQKDFHVGIVSGSKLPFFKDGLLWESSTKAYKWLTLLADVDHKQAFLAYMWEKSLSSIVTNPVQEASPASYYYDDSGVIYRHGAELGNCDDIFSLLTLLYCGTASKKLSFVASSGGRSVVPGTGSAVYITAARAGAATDSVADAQTPELCSPALQSQIVTEAKMQFFFELLSASTDIAIVVHEKNDKISGSLRSAWWGNKRNKNINILKEGQRFIHLWDCLNGYRLLTQNYVDAQEAIDVWYESQSKVSIANDATDVLFTGVLLHGLKLVNSFAYWSCGLCDGSVDLLNQERLWFLIKKSFGYFLCAILVKDSARYEQAYPTILSEGARFVIYSTEDPSKGIMASNEGKKYYLGRSVAVIPALTSEYPTLPTGLLHNYSYINADQLAVILAAVEDESLRSALGVYFGGGDFSNGRVDAPPVSNPSRRGAIFA